MKKLISLILTTLPLIACLAENAENEPLVGGWTINAENVAEIPQDVQDALTKAAEELTGCAYEPVALLASQVVSGMNYCRLCRLARRGEHVCAGLSLCRSGKQRLDHPRR